MVINHLNADEGKHLVRVDLEESKTRRDKKKKKTLETRNNTRAILIPAMYQGT